MSATEHPSNTTSATDRAAAKAPQRDCQSSTSPTTVWARRYRGEVSSLPPWPRRDQGQRPAGSQLADDRLRVAVVARLGGDDLHAAPAPHSPSRGQARDESGTLATREYPVLPRGMPQHKPPGNESGERLRLSGHAARSEDGVETARRSVAQEGAEALDDGRAVVRRKPGDERVQVVDREHRVPRALRLEGVREAKRSRGSSVKKTPDGTGA